MHRDLGARTGVAGTGLDLEQALFDFGHFLAEQLDHELGCRARQQDRCTTQGEVHFHDHGAHTVSRAEVFLGDHLAALQTTFHAAALDDQVALVHALDGADEDLVAARHEIVEQHFAFGVADLLQDHLLGGHGADATDGHALDRLFDVVALFDVGDLVARIGQQLFGVRVLQAGFIGHDEPTTEGLVGAGVRVHRDTDVHIALVEFFGGRGQRQFHGAQHHVAFDVFLARDGIDQHQHFAVHITRPPFRISFSDSKQLLPCISMQRVPFNGGPLRPGPAGP